jgi:hypothetical protein
MNINLPSNVRNIVGTRGNSFTNVNVKGLQTFLSETLKKPKNIPFLKNTELKSFIWFIQYNATEIFGTVATKVVDNKIYITHVAKKPGYKNPEFFKKMYDKVVSFYKKNLPQITTFELKAAKSKPQLIKYYESIGFVKSSETSVSFVMTKSEAPEQSAISLNLDSPKPFSPNTRNKLLAITQTRWLKARSMWQASNASSWKGLLLGNLAMSMFVMLNQYSLKPVKYVDKTKNFGNTGRNTGANYFYNERQPNVTHPPRNIPNRSKFGTYDIFRIGYNDTFEELKIQLLREFDIIYTAWLSQANAGSFTSPLDVINSIVKFFGRNNVIIRGTAYMNFYRANNGLFQWLTMKDPSGNIHTGNCTIIMLFRLAIYEKYTKGQARYITFVPESKMSRANYQNPFSVSDEICHYGFRMQGMTNQQQINAGVFSVAKVYNRAGQIVPAYPHLKNQLLLGKNTDYGYHYDTMFNQLTTNMIYRARFRAQRNNSTGVVEGELDKMSTFLLAMMNPHSKMLHYHRIR